MTSIFVDVEHRDLRVLEYPAVKTFFDAPPDPLQIGSHLYVISMGILYTFQGGLFIPRERFTPYSLPILTKPQDELVERIRDAGRYRLFTHSPGELVSQDGEVSITLRRVSLEAILRAGYIQEINVNETIFYQAIPKAGDPEIRYKVSEGSLGPCFPLPLLRDDNRATRLRSRLLE